MLSTLCAQERALHRQEIRRSEEELRQYLHHDFFEIGYSGWQYTFEDMLAAVADPPSERRICVEDERCLRLSEDSALLLYRSAEYCPGRNGLERRAHRCSLWWLTPRGWHLRFHQGTPMERW